MYNKSAGRPRGSIHGRRREPLPWNVSAGRHISTAGHYKTRILLSRLQIKQKKKKMYREKKEKEINNMWKVGKVLKKKRTTVASQQQQQQQQPHHHHQMDSFLSLSLSLSIYFFQTKWLHLHLTRKCLVYVLCKRERERDRKEFFSFTKKRGAAMKTTILGPCRHLHWKIMMMYSFGRRGFFSCCRATGQGAMPLFPLLLLTKLILVHNSM
jgi:hypothetical protein